MVQMSLSLVIPKHQNMDFKVELQKKKLERKFFDEPTLVC